MQTRAFWALLTWVFVAGCGPLAPPAQSDRQQSLPAAGLAPGYKLSLTPASNNSAPADGAATLALSARLTNGLNRPVTGMPIAFAAAAGGNLLFSSATFTTDCNGLARVNVAALSPGQYAIRATASMTAAVASLQFTCPERWLATASLIRSARL